MAFVSCLYFGNGNMWIGLYMWSGYEAVQHIGFDEKKNQQYNIII
jgi:hypothetical protein